MYSLTLEYFQLSLLLTSFYTTNNKDATINAPETTIPGGPIPNMGLTNILKLHLLAGGSIDDTDHKDGYFEGQRSLYTRGFGATKEELEKVRPEDKNTIPSLFEFGWGDIMGEQVNHMKVRLSNVYKEGDKVYVFGFSRGAASARIFANEILKDQTVPSIEFLGVYDTVLENQKMNPDEIKRNSAGFLPSTYCDGPENKGQLNPDIRKAFHCVSLDDPQFQRLLGPFPPTLVG